MKASRGLSCTDEEANLAPKPRTTSLKLVPRKATLKDLVLDLPSLSSCPPKERPELFIKKCRLASFAFKFFDDDEKSKLADSDPEALRLDTLRKQSKRNALRDILKYIIDQRPRFCEDQLLEIFQMFCSNIFRPLPSPRQGSPPPISGEMDVVVMFHESAWPHLQIIYEIIVRLLLNTTTDPVLLSRYFSSSFVLKLILALQSGDPRERDCIKTCLHRIYSKFTRLRYFIRKTVQDVFLDFIASERNTNPVPLTNGISELLEIMGSIINGFALPVKEQHKSFLLKVLMPLHSCRSLSQFHLPLFYCVMQFITKDASLSPHVFRSLLRYWPISNEKQCLFLQEIEEACDIVSPTHLGPSLVPLFRKVGDCIHNPHSQVAERALMFLSNNLIIKYVAPYREKLFTILSKPLLNNVASIAEEERIRLLNDREAMYDASNLSRLGVVPFYNVYAPGSRRWRQYGHWNPVITNMSMDVLRLFNEVDPALVTKVTTLYKEYNAASAERRIERQQRWTELLSSASSTTTAASPSPSPSSSFFLFVK